jgi:surfactin synthase thioesterase subunit
MHRSRLVLPLFPNDRASLDLLCFPYAAGGASSYRFLSRVLPDPVLEHLEVWAIEYPGHGGLRGREAPCTDFSSLVDMLADAVLPLFDGGEVALLGCSLGALVAFELARSLRGGAGANPRHLYVAACGAPQFPIASPDTSSVETLTAYLCALGIEPDEREIERRWPWYRAVYSLPSTYRYREIRPLDCQISVFGGLHDASVARETLSGWQEQTAFRPLSPHLVHGQHLFLRSLDFLRALTQDLLQDLGLLRHYSQKESGLYAYAM